MPSTPFLFTYYIQWYENRMEPLFVAKYGNDTCFFRNAQKQLKITHSDRNKSCFQFYLVYNGVWNFHYNYYSSFGDFVSTCIKIGDWFCITIFDVLTAFSSVFVYISYTVKMPLTYWLHSEVVSSSVFKLSKNIDILWKLALFYNILTWRIIFFLKECLCSIKV